MAATTKQLRLGFAGLGVAANQVLPGVRGLDYIKVAAAADLRQEALDAFASEYGGETFKDIEALCKSPNVDVVRVATPNHLHAEHVIMACEYKKHVIVEKPMAVTVAECESMVAAAKRNGVLLMQGHTKCQEAPFRTMGELVRSGEFGKLGMIQTWNYNDLVYRPRMPQELDPDRGGGSLFLQGPHQLDILRFIGGGMVRSVRGTVGDFIPSRRTDGAYTAYLEFEDGTPATAVFSGYAHYDTAELHYWIGEGGTQRDPETNWKQRAAIREAEQQGNEVEIKETWRYAGGGRNGEGGDGQGARPRVLKQPFFGLTLVSLEKADIRQSPDGLYVYGDDGKREIVLEDKMRGRAAELTEMYNAINEGRGVFPSGEWGMATLEAVVAIKESGLLKKEIILTHQSPVRV
jgi:phthalate 4,5-cis-dihydrodiol dehydrogenase